jgi:hypothetical protein
MTWLAWLAAAVVLTASIAVFGMQPKGTRPLARTHMMRGARIALLAVVIILIYIAYRSRT